MVLSNKKLKQRLREELSKSLVSAESNPPASAAPSSSSNSRSFRQLLGVKSGLSKREKRRKNVPLSAPGPVPETKDGENCVNPADGGDKEVRVQNGSISEKERKNTKRKRVEGDEKADLKADPDSKTEEKSKKKKKKKKKKAKKKNSVKEEGDQEKEEPVEAPELMDVSKEDQHGAQKDEISDGVLNQVNEEVSKKVYVGGIPYYSTEDDIRSFFDHCGTITEVDCMKFPETGKFRGIAILNFKTEEAAKRAMSLDGADMGGFFLKVQRYNKTTPQVAKTPAFSPPVIQGYNRIYAGNLSWNITEDDLKSFFSDCSVSSIRFGEDKETGAFKGYAHVDFSDKASLEKALKLDQAIVCGRPVRITCAVALRKPQLLQSSVKSNADSNISTSQSAVENEKLTSEGAVVEKTTSEAVVAVDSNTGGVSTGKMRRRNCYLCGERGHISSACPKQAAQQTDPATS